MRSSALLALVPLITPSQGAPFETSAQQHRVRPTTPYHGAVASESSECTQIGLDILKDGGNAADAMIATTLCVGTIGMYHSGIGGGGFALVRMANGSFDHVDFRESAPAAAHQDMYKNFTTGSILGGLASGVPSELRGLEYIHTNYGVLPWSQVVMPAVHIARNGFRVTADLVRYMAFATANSSDGNFLVNDANWAQDFAPSGKLVTLNDTLTRKRYANTLETIARLGVEEFYSGRMAEQIVSTIRDDGGIMTMRDLAEYKVVSRPAAQITYRNYTLTSCGAPAGGSVSLAMLKTIEGYPDMGEPASLNVSTHRFIEASRFAYAARSELGDPGLEVDSSAGKHNHNLTYEETLLSPRHAAHIRSLITDATTHNISYYDPSGIESPPSHGTSHIVTADATGLAVTLTTTVNLLFGSHLLDACSGIILNNEMNDFSIPGKSNAFGYLPSPANYIAPRKRPLSSVAPVIVTRTRDDSLYLVIGAAGGSRIISSVAQTLWNLLDRGMGLEGALAEPRLHDQLAPDVASFEWGFDNGTVADLRGRGHKVLWTRPGWSAVQGIMVGGGGGGDGGRGFVARGEPRQSNALGGVV